MTADQLRQLYLDFFKSKEHAIIPSSSLIPDNDPTVLFTTAGMHPLVPYLMGEKHPLGKRLANSQKCIRTGDIDEVGDNRHLTFFEMLGNWSLGDYFKKEAIEWSWEFLTGKQWLGMEAQRLYVTVFMGEGSISKDDESIKIWQECFKRAGITAEVCDYNKPIAGNKNYRIFPLPAKDNFWGPAGTTGPCGPCTEMFYDVEPRKGDLQKTFDEEIDAGRVMEVWNDVFMEFNKNASGQYEKLPAQNVDTGMGLERTLSVLNGKQDAFDNELFAPLFAKIEELSGKKYGGEKSPLTPSRIKYGTSSKGGELLPPFREGGGGFETTRAMRIIADHIKAATFILGDEKGIEPSNVGQGYVLRRLIRRAVRYGKQLGVENVFTFKVAQPVIEIYKEIYPELKKNKDFIENQLVKEEEKFGEVIQDGLKRAAKIIGQKKPVSVNVYLKMMQLSVKDKNDAFRKLYREKSEKNDFSEKFGISITNEEIFNATITGKESFDLYQTYGFPVEMIVELVQEKNLFVDIEDFEREVKKHQELSRTASAGMFKGGLADASEETIKYHTAAHLMLEALRQVLGDHITQKGSNITPERLRFDFSHSDKMTPEQIKQVEDIVNEKIKEDLPVKMEEMSLDEAKQVGATGVFESKYGEKVKVYSIGDFSKEICGGPHAERTGGLGKFKIAKEESSSAGVRRIKAVLE